MLITNLEIKWTYLLLLSTQVLESLGFKMEQGLLYTSCHTHDDASTCGEYELALCSCGIVYETVA